MPACSSDICSHNQGMMHFPAACLVTAESGFTVTPALETSWASPATHSAVSLQRQWSLISTVVAIKPEIISWSLPESSALGKHKAYEQAAA